MKHPAIIFIYVALAVSVLLVFWQVRNFDFVNYDDQVYVYENQKVMDGLTPEGVLWAFSNGHAANWHPVTWLSLMLDCQLFGLNPGRMHLVNVLLHLANTLLLFAVLKKMTGALWPSAFVAAAFALHPMHVESVAWIAERKDVLSTFFLLLTLAAYAGYVKRPSVFRYAATLLIFALGLMAKPMLVTLPFVLLLLDYWPLNRLELPWPEKKSSCQTCPSVSATNKYSNLYRLIIEKVPFIVLSAVSSTITFIIQRGGKMMVDTDIFSLESRLVNVFFSYVRYISKMFWPKDMAVLYPLNVVGGIAYRPLTLCVLLLASGTFLFLFFGRRRKYLPVGWFWFLGTLIPVIGLVQVGSQAYADRYTYIPYIGLFIMLAWGLPELLSTWPYRKAILGISMVIVLTVLGLCSHRQVSYWNNNFTLFLHASKVTQNNRLAYENLGAEYGKLGRYEETIEAYRQAIKLKSDDGDLHNNLGVAYSGLGRYGEAIEAFKQTIKIRPDDAKAYSNLGAIYGGLGRYGEAIEAYKQSIRIRPNFAGTHYSLGLAYLKVSNKTAAMEEYKILKTLNAEMADALFSGIPK